ncbi:hypothetical protein [Acrocarpospora corrugata]|uniref:hypothetical protein n=1 Tax=Acrocarpospora corrugata TaxID=35763 RepID=UPI0012D32DD1|nr:hypothetical protein [Acrocarpospora corrugata]
MGVVLAVLVGRVEARERVAGNGIDSPAAGAVVAGSEISAAAHIENVCEGTLSVLGPSGDVLGSKTERISTLCLGRASIQVNVGLQDSAGNGVYSARLTVKGVGEGAEHTFVVRRPPASPGGVMAEMQGKKVVVSWDKGVESDLRSYAVSTDSGDEVGTLVVADACSGGRCQAVFAVPGTAAGKELGFSVKAFRGDGAGGIVGSGNSAVTYVKAPAAVKPSPSRSAGGDVEEFPVLPDKNAAKEPQAKQREVVASEFPELPKADKIEDKSEFDLPEVADGSGATPPTVAEPEAIERSSAFGDGLTYGIYIAIGLLLLLLGGHVGAWLRRRTSERESAGGTISPSRSGAGGVISPPRGGVGSMGAVGRRPVVIFAVAEAPVAEIDTAEAETQDVPLLRPYVTRVIESEGDRSESGQLSLPPGASEDSM